MAWDSIRHKEPEYKAVLETPQVKYEGTSVDAVGLRILEDLLVAVHNVIPQAKIERDFDRVTLTYPERDGFYNDCALAEVTSEGIRFAGVVYRKELHAVVQDVMQKYAEQGFVEQDGHQQEQDGADYETGVTPLRVILYAGRRWYEYKDKLLPCDEYRELLGGLTPQERVEVAEQYGRRMYHQRKQELGTKSSIYPVEIRHTRFGCAFVYANRYVAYSHALHGHLMSCTEQRRAFCIEYIGKVLD